MSGAYVAKPAAVVPVDYPPGWNPDWPWPGPLPPGFDWSGYDWEADGLPPEETDDNGDAIPRIWVKPVDGLETNEHDDGEWSDEFFVCLTAEPKQGSITVPFVTSDSDKGVCDPVVYTFTSGGLSNWGNPRRVRLRGVNDEHIDGDVEYGIMIGPSISSVGAYNGLYGNGGVAVEVTSNEEVNRIKFVVSNITGYGSIASQVFRGVDEEDYIEIHAIIYQAPAGTTALSAFVDSGTAIADGWTRYYADGSKEHGGDAQDTSFTSLSVEASTTESYSYACVSSIRIGGKVGTTDNISCMGRMYFYHDDVLLEDYFASEVHENADNDQYFGMASYHAYAFLHNAETEGINKLVKSPATYIKEEDINWRIEVVISDISSSGGPVSWAAAAIDNGSGYAEVVSADGAAASIDTDGTTYFVAGTYMLIQSEMIQDIEDVVNISAYINVWEPPNTGAALISFLLDIYKKIERDDLSGVKTRIRKYYYTEEETTLSVSGSGEQADEVIEGYTFDIGGNLTITTY